MGIKTKGSFFLFFSIMKVILPVAGFGSRLRPFTLTKPKCLLSIAGKTLIEHICDSFATLSVSRKILVVGSLSEKIYQFVKDKSWENVSLVEQNDPQGLAQAIALCDSLLDDNEPVLIILGDTLFKADLSILASAETNILFTRVVEDPRRFGIVQKDESGRVIRLVEKPQEFISDEALVGIYYIKEVSRLRKALKFLLDNNIRTRGEFQLTDALQKMVEDGTEFRTAKLDAWLDCGTKEMLLETNGTLLSETQDSYDFPNSTIISPCFIGENVEIVDSVVGPNVSIDNGAKILSSKISNALVGENSIVRNSEIKDAALGESVVLEDHKGSVFLGDYSQVLK